MQVIQKTLDLTVKYLQNKVGMRLVSSNGASVAFMSQNSEIWTMTASCAQRTLRLYSYTSKSNSDTRSDKGYVEGAPQNPLFQDLQTTASTSSVKIEELHINTGPISQSGSGSMFTKYSVVR